MVRCHRALVSVARLGVAALLLLGVAAPATAAVRQCGQPIIGTGQDAKSEAVARRKALAEWQLRASRLGPQWAGWSIAHRKALSCRRLGDGAIECHAAALPCTIVQNPNQPVPPPRPSPPQPASKSIAI
jgi:hypothetical protein